MSGWNSQIVLITPGGWSTDQYGNQIQLEPQQHTVWANPWAVSATYMLKAATENQRQARQYQIRSIEYLGEEDAEIDGVNYKISASPRGEYVLLTLTEVTGSGERN